MNKVLTLLRLQLSQAKLDAQRETANAIEIRDKLARCFDEHNRMYEAYVLPHGLWKDSLVTCKAMYKDYRQLEEELVYSIRILEVIHYHPPEVD